jgi:hypothetical protein
VDQAKRLKELEQENAKLKRLFAELSLDRLVLKDIAAGNVWSAPLLQAQGCYRYRAPAGPGPSLPVQIHCRAALKSWIFGRLLYLNLGLTGSLNRFASAACPAPGGTMHVRSERV